MRIRSIEPVGAAIPLLDFLDVSTLPGDEPYQKAGALWWIVYDGRSPVAFAGLKRWGASMGFLCRAGVLKEARGQGLQRRLIRVRELSAKRIGIKTIITYTHPKNICSANNLIRCGYILYNPQDAWGCEDALYFWKDL